MPHKRGKLFIISGPSGAGKGSVINKAKETGPDIRTTVSVTTRPRRPQEQDGRDYFFVSDKEFEKKIKKGYFIEWVELYGFKYGTPLDQVEESLSRGQNIFLEIDVKGAEKIKAKIPESVLIFIMPPSMEELEKRLKKRKTENKDILDKRIKVAEREIESQDFYDYVVVNDKLEEAAEKLTKIIRQESDTANG